VCKRRCLRVERVGHPDGGPRGRLPPTD
jgi:hypothetical protein